jgi:hypothetical protein
VLSTISNILQDRAKVKMAATAQAATTKVKAILVNPRKAYGKMEV